MQPPNGLQGHSHANQPVHHTPIVDVNGAMIDILTTTDIMTAALPTFSFCLAP